MEIIIYGIISGIFAGLLPGFATLTTLLTLYPLIIKWNVFDVVLFYATLCATSQYMGSIAALYLNIPGESSSIFAVKEASNLRKSGQLNRALYLTAIGSTIGAILGIGITLVFLDILEPFITYFFTTKVKIMLFILVFISFIFISNNKWYTSILLFLLGFALNLPGISTYGDVRWTLGFKDLENGLPNFPVMLGLYVIPLLYQELWKLKVNYNSIVYEKVTWIPSIAQVWIMIRSSCIGFIGGLVPSLTTIIASKLAYSYESLKKNSTSLSRVIAAETANNSAALSMLLPLLLLGIPILVSEAVILDIVEKKGFVFNWTNIVESGFYLKLCISLLFVNILCVFISYFSTSYLIKIYQIPSKILCGILVAVLSYICYSISVEYNVVSYHLSVLLVLLPFGFMLRKLDLLPLLTAFLLGTQIEDNFIRFYLLYLT